MARKLNNVTPDIGAPDTENPDGTYLDEGVSVPGSPLFAAEGNSIYYFFSKMMSLAGIVFNNIADTFKNSQFIDSVLFLIGKNGRNNARNTQDRTGIIIPLYVYPTDVYNNVTYNNLIDLAKDNRDVPIIVILNPSSGPGGSTDGNYEAAIKRLQGANIKVLGYVSTNYAATAIATVKADVDGWKTYYPGVNGIFYDEMTFEDDQDDIDYYEELNRYAKSEGMPLVVTNPGAPFSGNYQRDNVADIIIGWENSSFPTLVQAKEDFANGAFDYPLNKRGAIVHGQVSYDTAEALQLSKYYGWIYITDDVSPNPYDAISGYMSDMVASVRAANSIYIMDQNLRTTDNVTFNSTKTNNYFEKCKKFTGTAGGATLIVAHGLSDAEVDKILNISCYYKGGGNDRWILVVNASGNKDDYITNSTAGANPSSVVINGTASITGQAYRIKVTYEA